MFLFSTQQPKEKKKKNRGFLRNDNLWWKLTYFSCLLIISLSNFERSPFRWYHRWDLSHTKYLSTDGRIVTNRGDRRHVGSFCPRDLSIVLNTHEGLYCTLIFNSFSLLLYRYINWFNNDCNNLCLPISRSTRPFLYI